MCIGFFWGAATIIISTWKKVKDISASWFFLHVFLQFSADYPLSPVGLVLLNIFLGTGHREPDGLIKLNLYWQDSFVYFRLPAGWGKKKCLVCYLARYKLWKYGPAATWYVSISVFFFRGVKSFLKTGIFWTLVPLNQKLPGFFLSCSFPLNLNCSFLPLPHPVSPFKSVDIHQIQQPPHLHATASLTESSELKSQICSLTWGFLTRSSSNGCAFASYFLFSETTAHNVVGSCRWQKRPAMIWKS